VAWAIDCSFHVSISKALINQITRSWIVCNEQKDQDVDAKEGDDD